MIKTLMEPLDSDCPTSQTGIRNVENGECRTPSPVTSYAGSDCSISAAKFDACAAADAAVEERNDVMLRLLGHLIPGPSGPEEGSANETQNSNESTPSMLKRRLHELPPPSEAIKLTDRLAALNHRIRKERDLYLHLQGLNNRIEEKDEANLTTTDSSKTINSTSNRHYQDQISNARARRRERLRLCSPDLSSPEPLTLREISEDFTQGMNQFSSPIRDRCQIENDPIINLLRENIVADLSNPLSTQEFEMADQMMSSRQNESQFSSQSCRGQGLCPVVSDCKNSTALTAKFDFEDAYSKEGLIGCNLSPETDNARFQATTSSTGSSPGVDYAYVTRKRTPMKFGGYRPASGLIFRNLSSDSESEANSDRISDKRLLSQNFPKEIRTSLEIDEAGEHELQESDFSSSHLCHNPDRTMNVEPFSIEKIEIRDERLLSPELSTGSRLSFEASNHSHRLDTCSRRQVVQETDWAHISESTGDRYVGEIGNLVKPSASLVHNDDHFDHTQFIKKSFEVSTSRENNAYTENSLKSVRQNHINFSGENTEDTSSFLSSKQQSLNSKIESANDQSVLETSVRSLPENIYTYSSVLGETGDDIADSHERTKVPPLEIESQDYSHSQSLSSEDKGETTRSSLDVNALIQALSDVSLKQENLTNRTKQSNLKLKSPLGYRNRFSGSSGPRSSEYTPAAGGSMQSLTSLEVSETHSVKIPKSELTAPVQGTALLKLEKQSSRSASRTPEGFQALSKLPSNVKRSPIVSAIRLKEQPVEIDLIRGSSFIPVVAKVNKTSLVCPKHPLRIKSIGKLISPRKYPNSDFGGEVANPLTSRTEVSQSSEGSKKSFRSLKMGQIVTNMRGNKIDGLQLKTDSISRSAPLSGRRILEPLNLVPEIQTDLLNSLDRKLNRRKKIAKDLSEIISSQSGADSERTTISNTSRSSFRKNPALRANRADRELPIHRFAQRLEIPIPQSKHSADNPGRRSTHHTELSSSGKTPGKPFHRTNRTSRKHDQKSFQHSFNDQKCSGFSSGKSSVTSDNVLCLRSERLSLSSGDYEEKINWSPKSRGVDSTENDYTYKPENKLNNQDQAVSAGRKKIFEAIDLHAEKMGSSDFATNCYAEELARSFRNCVHLNDLQDGGEVTLPCKNAKCEEDNVREKELFKRLPNEISGSLTRHASFGTQVTKNLHSSKEMPSTIEDLSKNIQENNDQWIRDFKNNEALDNPLLASANDETSSTSSPVRFEHYRSPNSIQEPTKIHQDIIDLGEKSENNNEPVKLDSQRSSLIHSDTDSCHDRIAKSTDCSAVLKFDQIFNSEISKGPFIPPIRDSSTIELFGSFKKDQAVNAEIQNARLCDIQVISSTANVTSGQKRSANTPFSAHASDSNSDTDKHYRKALKLSADTKSVPHNDVEAVEFVPSNMTRFESFKVDDIVSISQYDSVPNAPLECSQLQPMALGDCHKYSEQGEQKSMSVCCDQENQFANELQDQSSSSRAFANGSDNPCSERCSDNEFGVCEKKSSPSSPKSAKSQAIKQHHSEAPTSSPVSIKSFLSMSKLNSSADSKRDVIVATGANSVRKSQDRFPFTISESASRKTSKFKVVADLSLEQLMQDQNYHFERSDAVLTQQPILAKPGDQEEATIETHDTEQKIDSCQGSLVRQLTPFFEELTSKISNHTPRNWDTQTPFVGLNYMSYGCQEEPRTPLFTVKEMVKKFSAKLRYVRTKRRRDPEETKVEVLYRNKKCRCESGEGSSSAASLYQSQLLTNSKLNSGRICQGNNDGSRASSGKAVKPKRNHECISMGMQQSPRKGCERNDLWIQEFDSDVEFRSQVSTASYHPEPKRKASSPANDRYSMFFARRKLSGVIDEADYNRHADIGSVLNYCEDEDSEKVNCKRPEEVCDVFTEIPEVASKSPRTPANSYNDETNEFETDTKGNNSEESTAKSGCCCFRIYHFLATSKKHKSTARRRIKF